MNDFVLLIKNICEIKPLFVISQTKTKLFCIFDTIYLKACKNKHTHKKKKFSIISNKSILELF